MSNENEWVYRILSLIGIVAFVAMLCYLSMCR